MAGDNPPNPKGSSSSHPRKSGNNPRPSSSNPTPFPENLGPPPLPPPASGFHMLERRTIALADGTVRSYLALPPDYQDIPPPRPRPLIDPSARLFPPHAPELGPGLGFDPIHGLQDHYRLDGSHKRKFSDEGNIEFARQRQQLLQYGNAVPNSHGSYMAGPSSSPFHPDDDDLRAGKHTRAQGDYKRNAPLNKHSEVDQAKLRMAFLKFLRLMNENADQKTKYLADGKKGSLQCLACGRSSKEFSDMHSLIMHSYNSDNATSDQVLDHLGLHKASCVLMGWNYVMAPDDLKAYQLLSAEEAAANKDDLIMWPPHVIIQNTFTGKGRPGHMEGLSSKTVDNKLRDLGFSSGKSKSMYGREGHMGITAVKFAGDESGLKDAMRLAEFFEKEKRGQRAWASVQSLLTSRKDEENNPNLVKLDKKTGEKERILYGYLGTAFDLDKLDSETRKNVTIASRREHNPHQ